MISDFIKLSTLAGTRADWVQAGGGNSSVKINDHEMYVKASGYQLSEVSTEKGWSKVNYKKIADFFKLNPNNNDLKECEKDLIASSFIAGEKPSIETFLHSMTQKVTLHTHPTLINAILTRDNYVNIINELFPDSIIIDYQTPGILLAELLFAKTSGSASNLIFLQNHGLIVTGDSVSHVIDVTNSTVDKAAEFLKINNQKYRNISLIYDMIKKLSSSFCGVVHITENTHISQALIKNNFQIWDYNFCPDCIVYCGTNAYVSVGDINFQKFKNHIDTFGMPRIIIINDNLYIIASSNKKAYEVESVLSFSAQIFLLNITSNVVLLDKDEQFYLQNWEAEKYRQDSR